MKKIAFVTHNNQQSKHVLHNMKAQLTSFSLYEDSQNPDIVISIGGDGTFLTAFHRYQHRLKDVYFIGIHTGRLGFYTDWQPQQTLQLLESLTQQQLTPRAYPLLSIKVISFDHRQIQKDHYLALNEFTLRNLHKTMVTDVFIDQTYLECFRGDGISVATPTGSTAYNKSVGGAILHPSIPALQLTEIASLNNRIYRTLGAPIITAPHEHILFTFPESPPKYITVDHQLKEYNQLKEIQCSIAKQQIQFLSQGHRHFWERVHHAFIGPEYSKKSGKE